MSDLQSLAFTLDQSLIPATSKQAEQSLRSQESIKGFPLTLLQIVASANLQVSTRLAAALFFKNYIKRKWVDEDGNYITEDAQLIKSEIIPLMITLPNNLQIQIGEAISVIADSDFPEKWPTLIDDLVLKLSEEDMINNKGVLTVAHSIFKRWRPLFRSDALFLEIKLVLDKFSVPFLNLLKRVDALIEENRSNKAQLLILFDVLLLLVKIYFDLNCQDIPEFFEDHLNEGMGVIHKYFLYYNEILVEQDEDEEIDIVTKVKTSISELIQLYTTRYEDVFEPLIPSFIQSTWNLLTTTGQQKKYDILVSRLLSFLTSTVKLPQNAGTFVNDSALKEISQRVIIPNLTARESDEELFEDDPIEYIRRDLEGSDSETRRRASIDLLRELKSTNESKVTEVILEYINNYLKQYESNPSDWKFKDLAIYLFTALAAKGSVTTSGITSTNLLLDVVDFFTKNILSDLINTNIHPILKVDAIKYIFIFRNQLTKEQLLESFPILANHLQSSEYVQYTYAAITIEKILSIRDSNKGLLFNKLDIQPFVQQLLTAIFKLILTHSHSPDKLAENEFLMKAIMRILLIAEDSISEFSVDLIQQLLLIVNIISKNPSNPKFTHFTFEAISVILKFNNTQKWQQLSDVVVPSFLVLLGEDVQEFVPYIFQIFAYELESSPKTTALPEPFKQLIQPLLSPAVWEFRGNIPAITRLLRSIVSKDQSVFADLSPLLGVFQKLISSKVNDNFGFDLLETIITSVPDDRLQNFSKGIAMLLLQRLQLLKTDRYVKKLAVFLSELSIIKSVSYAIGFFEQVQTGVFSTIFQQFLLPAVANIHNPIEKKIVIVGLTNLATDPAIYSGELGVPTYEKLIEIIAFIETVGNKAEKDEATELEFDETRSFGSNFSRLVAIVDKQIDPTPPDVVNVNDSKTYFVNRISELNTKSSEPIFSHLKQQFGPEAIKNLDSIGLF